MFLEFLDFLFVIAKIALFFIASIPNLFPSNFWPFTPKNTEFFLKTGRFYRLKQQLKILTLYFTTSWIWLFFCLAKWNFHHLKALNNYAVHPTANTSVLTLPRLSQHRFFLEPKPKMLRLIQYHATSRKGVDQTLPISAFSMLNLRVIFHT